MRLIEIAQAGPLKTAPSISQIIVGAMNALVTIIGLLAVLMIVIGGVMYITASGDPKRAGLAKATITGGVIGLVIAISSFAIVYTISSLV